MTLQVEWDRIQTSSHREDTGVALPTWWRLPLRRREKGFPSNSHPVSVKPVADCAYCGYERPPCRIRLYPPSLGASTSEERYYP